MFTFQINEYAIFSNTSVIFTPLCGSLIGQDLLYLMVVLHCQRKSDFLVTYKIYNNKVLSKTPYYRGNQSNKETKQQR